MGGTALKKYDIETKRVSTEELIGLYNHVSYELKNGIDGFIESSIVKFYNCKETHGDLDCVILLKPSASRTNYKEVVQQIFKPRAAFCNDGVVTCDIWNVQCDILFVTNEIDYNNQLNFRNYSPFGNIYSRLIKQFGVRLGMRGLEYPVELSDSEYLGDVPLSNNLYRILGFGGLSPGVYYNEGFENQSDIFEYVYSSPYFNREIFLFENLNHVNKKRDKTRPDYNAWMQFVENKTSKFTGDPDKTKYIPYISRVFDVDIAGQINAMMEKHEKLKETRAKLNGTLVMSYIPGLEGRGLGSYLSAYKNKFSDLIKEESAEFIKQHFIKWYNWETSLLKLQNIND